MARACLSPDRSEPGTAANTQGNRSRTRGDGDDLESAHDGPGQRSAAPGGRGRGRAHRAHHGHRRGDAGPRSLTPGFLLERGRYTTIEVPGATGETSALGINNRGQIVGATSTGPGQEPHGFLLRGGAGGPFTPIDVPGAPGTSATGINDAGVIVGVYTNPNATPSPQPTATLMSRMG